MSPNLQGQQQTRVLQLTDNTIENGQGIVTLCFAPKRKNCGGFYCIWHCFAPLVLSGLLLFDCKILVQKLKCNLQFSTRQKSISILFLLTFLLSTFLLFSQCSGGLLSCLLFPSLCFSFSAFLLFSQGSAGLLSFLLFSSPCFSFSAFLFFSLSNFLLFTCFCGCFL